MLKYHRNHYKYQWYHAHFSLQDLTIKKKKKFLRASSSLDIQENEGQDLIFCSHGD